MVWVSIVRGLGGLGEYWGEYCAWCETCGMRVLWWCESSGWCGVSLVVGVSFVGGVSLGVAVSCESCVV